MHACSAQRFPEPHCASLLHSTHLLSPQTNGALQSLSELQVGPFDLSPHEIALAIETKPAIAIHAPIRAWFIASKPKWTQHVSQIC